MYPVLSKVIIMHIITSCFYMLHLKLCSYDQLHLLSDIFSYNSSIKIGAVCTGYLFSLLILHSMR